MSVDRKGQNQPGKRMWGATDDLGEKVQSAEAESYRKSKKCEEKEEGQKSST